VEGFAERSKIKVDLEIPPHFRRLSNDQEIAIFRVIQECLTNIHRHSESPTAAISMHQQEDRMLIRVQDSGKGIPREKQRDLVRTGRSGVGFAGMRERLRELGGSLEIRSEGKGTLVTATLPVKETNR
jgi:two-component system, NarL family, sensor kinase